MMVCSIARSKVKVTSPSKLEILTFINSYLLCHLQWELAIDHWYLNYGTMCKFLSGPIFCLSFCVTWLWTWQKRELWRVDRQSHMGLSFFCLVRNWPVTTQNGENCKWLVWKTTDTRHFRAHLQCSLLDFTSLQSTFAITIMFCGLFLDKDV